MSYIASAIVLNWDEAHVSYDSVQRLLKENIEVIVVDNGSTDDSVEKFQSLRDQIKFVALNDNYGSSIGRNLGIELTTCQYTFLLDGDILYVPGTIAEYIKILEKYPEAGCVGYFDIVHRETHGWGHGANTREEADEVMPVLTDKNKIACWYPIAWTQYGLFRTELLKQYKFPTLDPFNKPGYGYEDDWFYKDMCKDGWESLHIDKPLYYHDKHFSQRNLRRKNQSDMSKERRHVFYKHWGPSSLSGDHIGEARIPIKYKN